jgi:hypothetical protein
MRYYLVLFTCLLSLPLFSLGVGKYIIDINKKIYEVAHYRITKKPTFLFLDKSEFVKVLKEKLKKDPSIKNIYIIEKALKFFGLLNKDDNLQKAYKKLYFSFAGGFYDPFSKQFYMLKEFPKNFLKPILYHEYYHFYQDLRYDILQFLENEKLYAFDDRVIVRKAILEGEAILFGLRFYNFSITETKFSLNTLIKALRKSKLPLADMPYYVILESSFIYEYGEKFLNFFLTLHKWKDITTIYYNPPSSSYVLFYPQSYFLKEVSTCPLVFPKNAFSFGYFRWYILLAMNYGIKKAKEILDGFVCDWVKVDEDFVDFDVYFYDYSKKRYFLKYLQALQSPKNK